MRNDWRITAQLPIYSLKKRRSEEMLRKNATRKSGIMLLTLIFSMYIFQPYTFHYAYASNVNKEQVYYVATNGNDNNPGTLNAPFKTLEKARDTVREYIANGMKTNVTVYIRGGIYRVSKPIAFDERDSGRDGFKVIYKKYHNEEPIFSGSVPITEWTRYTDNIYKANIGNLRFNTLYENGKRAYFARKPNKQGDGKNIYMLTDKNGKGHLPNGEITAVLKKEDIPVMSDISQLQIHLNGGWVSNTLNVKSVNYQTGEITLSTYTWVPEKGVNAGARYYLQNARELLDAPGEFYLDEKTGTLYYQPYSNQPIKSLEIEAPVTKRIIEVKGSSEEKIVHDITFDGLTIRYTDFSEEFIRNAFFDSPGDGVIYTENAENITIKYGKMYGAGINGIYMYGHNQHNEVYGNKIYNIGNSGISLQGPDGENLISRSINHDNVISNNLIYNAGQLSVTYGAGVNLRQSGNNKVSYNRIFNTARAAILLDNQFDITRLIGKTTKDGVLLTKENIQNFVFTRNNVIEYNDISNTSVEGGDTAPIYSNTAGPTIVNNNWIHDSKSGIGSYIYGIYFDVKQMPGSKIINNIVSGINDGTQPFFTNESRDYDITNNIFADNTALQTFFLGAHPHAWPFTPDVHINRNIITDTATVTRNIYNTFNQYITQSEYNLFYEEGYANSGEDVSHKFNRFILTEDPVYMDKAKGDYRLKYNSPAYSQGFKTINMKDIGLRQDFPFHDQSDELSRLILTTGKSGNQSWVDLKKGEHIQLDLMVRTKTGYIADLKNVEVKYVSHNKNVAIVSGSGKIKAVGKGVASIEVAVTKNGKTVSSTFDVLVNDTIASIELRTKAQTVFIGRDFSLLPVIKTELGRFYDSFDTHVTYVSSNKAVATVNDQGLVTGKSEGYTIITVTIEKDGVTKQSAIMLEVESPKLDRVKVNAGTYEFAVGKSYNLTVNGFLNTGEQIDNSQTITTFRSENNEVAQVSSEGVLKVIADGKAIIDAEMNYKGQIKTGKLVVMTDSKSIKIEAEKCSDKSEGLDVLSNYISNKWNTPNVWAKYSGIDFKNGEYKEMTIAAAVSQNLSGAVLKVTLDRSDGPVVGEIVLTAGQSSKDFKPRSILFQTPVTGVHDVYLTLVSAAAGQIDWFKLNQQPSVEANDIHITIPNQLMKVGGTQPIWAKVLDQNYDPMNVNVKFSSDNNQIIKIENNTIKALGTGSANITAIYGNLKRVIRVMVQG